MRVELDSKNGDVYELRFREIPTELKEASLIGEDNGRLVQQSNLMAKDGTYDFLPGLEMDDIRALVVPVKASVLITAEIKKMSDRLGEDGKPDFDYLMSSTIVPVNDKK